MRLVVFIAAAIAWQQTARAAPTAEDLFNEGQRAYDDANYALAVERWNNSYRLSKEPALFYNIAQAYRLAGDCAHALSSYRQFVAFDPSSERRPLADEFVSELEPTCGQPSDPREVTRPVRNQDAGRNLKVVGLAIGSVGVVSVATGLYFGHRASLLGEEVTNACRSGCDWAMYRSKDAEGRGAQTKQYVLVGIGGAAIIGGGVLYWLASREHVQPSIAITSGRDGAAITWSGSW